jgi:hypothetical protein
VTYLFLFDTHTFPLLPAFNSMLSICAYLHMLHFPPIFHTFLALEYQTPLSSISVFAYSLQVLQFVLICSTNLHMDMCKQ